MRNEWMEKSETKIYLCELKSLWKKWICELSQESVSYF